MKKTSITNQSEFYINQQSVYNALKTKKFKIFENDVQPYNLNIIGIRSQNPVVNTFDDWIVLMWKYHGSWEFLKFKATTDPGLYWLKNPGNKLGTAILKEGQYTKTFEIGLHKGRYKALVQKKEVTVIRDANRNAKLDIVGGKEDKGIFGINIHRAKLNGESVQVDKWSAGCQVIANSFQFDQFMALCEQAAGIWGKEFTYTLINTKDLK